MKKKILTLLFATMLTGALLTGCGEPEQTKKSVTVEAGEELKLNAKDFFNTSDDKLKEIKFDTKKVDTSKVGEYKVTATYKKEKYTITVKVKDTKAPEVTMKQQYLFTNDVANADLTQLVDTVYDASEYTMELTNFEKTAELSLMDDNALNTLVDSIVYPGDQKELLSMGTKDIPTDEGVYKSALVVTDKEGNKTANEVYVILDKTGALIDDVEDMTVEQEDVTATPEVDLTQYHVEDIVDGVIGSDKYTAEMKLTDEANHQYTVYVSYTDRAGNESKAEFLVNVTEKKKATASNEGSGNKNSDKGGKGNNDGNSGGNKNGGGGGNGNGGSSSGGSGSSGGTSNDNTVNNAIDAGQLYTVISLSDRYEVIVGQDEFERGCNILDDYLASIGYASTQMGGGNYGDTGYMCVYVFFSDMTPLE